MVPIVSGEYICIIRIYFVLIGCHMPMYNTCNCVGDAYLGSLSATGLAGGCCHGSADRRVSSQGDTSGVRGGELIVCFA